jgi:hypothetical protein
MSDVTPKLQLLSPQGSDLINVLTQIYNNFHRIDDYTNAFNCTSSTRPTGANRFVGLRIFETDTGANGIWDGSKWNMYDTQWQPFIFPVTSTGSGFVMGTGQGRTGKYMRNGQRCRYQGRAIFGASGVAPGSAGTYKVGLPINADSATIGDNILLGTIWYRSVAGIADYITGGALIDTATTTTFRGLTGNNTSSVWGPAAPVAPAANDWFSFDFEYGTV